MQTRRKKKQRKEDTHTHTLNKERTPLLSGGLCLGMTLAWLAFTTIPQTDARIIGVCSPRCYTEIVGGGPCILKLHTPTVTLSPNALEVLNRLRVHWRHN